MPQRLEHQSQNKYDKFVPEENKLIFFRDSYRFICKINPFDNYFLYTKGVTLYFMKIRTIQSI